LQSPRISRLLSTLSASAAPARVADEFWTEANGSGTPLVEPCDDETVLVTFLWRGEARSSRAWWGVDVPLVQIPSTDLWYGTTILPAALRTIYCLTHDGAEGAPPDGTGSGASHVNLGNPRAVHFPADPVDQVDTEHWFSLLELPAAPEEPWTDPRPGVAAGELVDAELHSAALGGVRPVTVYRPAATPIAGLPILVVFDGFLARHVLHIPTVLDNLVAAGRIPPLAALFVTSFCDSRDSDYSPADPIHDFVGGELMPWAQRELGAGLDRSANLIAGASRGGLVSAYLGLRRPDLFGAVLSQSGSFWWPAPGEGEPEFLIREVARFPRSDTRFYLDVGVRETMTGPGGSPDQLTVVRHMREALTGHGFRVDYTEYVGSHDYVNWRRTFADGLQSLSGARVP
jgi:enterochelin esterase-like enzyme